MSTNIIARLEAFIAQYITFTDPAHAFVAALWAIGTHLYQHFDATPYLCITSPTKRSGKTRLAEVLLKVVARGDLITAASVGGIYQSIRDDAPTMFVDEAEVLGKENAGSLALRAILNSGYRLKGAVKRYSAKGAQWWPTYCPKGFILIGDVFDTLRDRSIVVQLLRGEPARRFVDAIATTEGHALRYSIDSTLYEVPGEPLVLRQEESEDGAAHRSAADALKERVLSVEGEAIVAEYRRRASEEGLPFLTDREAELWCSLFAICTVLAPERVEALTRLAVDLAAEKTRERTTYRELQGVESKTEEDDYRVRLLRDVATVLDGHSHIYTADLIAGLCAIATAPWRKFRGGEMTPDLLARMLDPLGVAPRLIKSRVGPKPKRGEGGRVAKVARGYKRDDVLRAIAKLGDEPPAA